MRCGAALRAAPQRERLENRSMKYWLMKSEPDECSIDDVLAAAGRTTPWSGVRNYQARNFMRDAMRIGDGVLFYHSSCEVPGIAGLAEVASAAYPDESQFDRKSPYYDPASKRDAPRWFNVDVRALRKTRLVPLAELRAEKKLARMRLLRPGNRLSITPVSAAEWRLIGKLLA
jgi:predicted RNA-binding protein with PUA-like domain